MVREFTEKEVAPRDKWMDENGYDHELYEKMSKAGFGSIPIPREYGGAGCDFLTSTLVIYELAKGSASIAINQDSLWLSADMILCHGTEEQKKKYLPLACQGKRFCFALTESCGGSDAAAIKSVAQKTEDGWILNGSKAWITNSEADYYVIMGGTDTVSAVLLGDDATELAGTLFAYGAEQVILLQHKNLKTYKHRPYTEALVALSEKYKPSIFLFAASPNGRELAPRVMARLGTGLTADAIDLDIDEDGVFVQTTPNYGGSILSHIAIPEMRPQMVTVHPKVFAPLEPNHNAAGELIIEKLDVMLDDDYMVLETVMKPVLGKPLSESAVLVSGGRGVKKQEDLEMLSELAALLGGQLACSRPLTDLGWLGHEKQIGQSGANVKPELIINVAVSGSVQYVSGMQNSKCIMSINHTASAPIYEVSHYGVVMDYSKLVPAIIAEIKKRKK